MAGTCPSAVDPIGKNYQPIVIMQFYKQNLFSLAVLFICLANAAEGQALSRAVPVREGAAVEIVNRFGRVDVSAESKSKEGDNTEASEKKASKATLTAISSEAVAESEVKIDSGSSLVRITVQATSPSKRIDITLVIPERSNVKIETGEGEVRVSGNLESIEVRTETGTIAADVPTGDLKYRLFWTESRPRFLSDFEIEKVKEKSAGKFEIKGEYPKGRENKRDDKETRPTGVNATAMEHADLTGGNAPTTERATSEDQKLQAISLNLITARGIILLNVPPNEVASDLRERPLTNAAKAIIRSGDSLLTGSIRRAAPKYFGDYARTLPPAKREPSFAEKTDAADLPEAKIKQAVVRVTDLNNRTIGGLKPADFLITENNEEREILSVQGATAPVNLVLLLDVSGSVDNYVNFIRKAARNFVDTVGRNDRLSIVIFNDDVKVLSGFTTDKVKLSATLDTFDAGGSTAFYDSLAYTLTETLRPLKGERTAIVILTDGDDNRSFLAFDSLIGSIQESGALIYPLYVPSGLIASSSGSDPNAAIDPLRTRYNGLTSKAEGEGEKLGKISGGVYYPITHLSQIQTAYDDIVVQLRTAYSITFRSNTAGSKGNGASPRLKIKTTKENAFTSIGSVTGVTEK
ncbi:MAG: VWA domain-containing protein [Saprospiraceae bacterium]|nr:VWA domain-containing protein [Pyrinomonadaceae bacterium]